ncbi:MAG: hypothetical protein RX318_03885 [bacterium]|nr:hypothetical protein [bacterium]
MPKQAVDVMLDGIRSGWEAKQADYLAINGRHFQGIQTHDAIPTLGAEAAPDKSKKPTDQPHDWDDFGLGLPGTMPGSIALHVYEGATRVPDETRPRGFRLEPYHGYELEARTREGLVVWGRTEAYGPEAAHRTRPWTDVTPEV